MSFGSFECNWKRFGSPSVLITPEYGTFQYV